MAKRSSRHTTKLAMVASVFLFLTLLCHKLFWTVSRTLYSSDPLADFQILEPKPKSTHHHHHGNQQQQQPRQRHETSSQHATVMGMATSYDVDVFKRFVGSLRRTGFMGHIILAISPKPQRGVIAYLNRRNVTMKSLTLVNCSTDILGLDKNNSKSTMNVHDVEIMTCAAPYPELKLRWGRFALLHDYLVECTQCTGPVLVADVRDTVFQRNPFGPEAPIVKNGLQVFEEHRTMRTTHWLVRQPVEQCKGITPIFDQPMLCSGTTIGTRDAMLQYLSAMVHEMRVWMQDPNCCCNKMNGDDQAIHNYLYYTGQLPFATPQKNRVGLVHTVGSQGAMLFNAKRKHNMIELNMTQRDASIKPYTSYADEANGYWLGLEHDLTDENGFFIDFNGERSFIVHQYDRFGRPMDQWLDLHSGLRDP